MTTYRAGDDPSARSPRHAVPVHMDLSRGRSQRLPDAPRSIPRQNVNDVTDALRRAQEMMPAFKRRKLNESSESDKHVETEIPNPSSSLSNAAVASTTQTDGEGSRNIQTSLFPPRPRKNLLDVGPQERSATPIKGIAVRPPVPLFAFKPEIPSVAPRYQNSDPADFHPWTGKHPEDILNEATTRSGAFDKVQNPQTELISARQSIWPSLKYKSGLQTLSSLYISALNQRQVKGIITQSSAFKPPPRVTLTESRKEAWLRDLANPSIPLRRLSRTIPHGIRGKILLNHCLSKCIPVRRAIWLIKCVGANEIRAFRRKGASGVFAVGGEARWIKEWTSNIEQFLESTLCACGGAEWKANVVSSLRLASDIYAEHLLDQDHFLDWLIERLTASDLDTMPVWLLILKNHEGDLLAQRQRGIRLIEALLRHLQQAFEPANREVYDSVLQELSENLVSMIVSVPACFILPRCWIKYQTVIRICLFKGNDSIKPDFDHLSGRNIHLLDYRSQQELQPRTPSERTIVDLLDDLYTEREIGRVAGSLLRITEDHTMLVQTCIKWATSVYRYGKFRVYAAARLLRIWSRHTIDLQWPILELLSSDANPSGLHKPDIYRLLAELVSSKHFSVGRYLQWIMARGDVRNLQSASPDAPCDVRLLHELPLHGLPAHTVNLRRSLVSPSQDQVIAEANMLEEVKLSIARRLPAWLFPVDSSEDLQPQPLDYTLLSRAAKSDTARWIRHILASQRHSPTFASSKRRTDDLDPAVKRGMDITVEQFHFIRSVLEDFDEFAILADVLNILSSATQCSTLTAVADTVNYHFDIFKALGAAEDLFQCLYSQRHRWTLREVMERSFADSLIDLGSRLTNAKQEVHRLRKELLTLGSKLSAAACSPISDTMVEAVQADEPTFADDMDQMLASGTSMDTSTLVRVFQTIVGRLEKSWRESGISTARCSDLLARLRTFSPEPFDALVNEWLDSVLIRDDRTGLRLMLPPMICSKVIFLRVALDRVAHLVQCEVPNRGATIALDALEIIEDACSERMPTVDYRAYRLRDQQQHLIRVGGEPLVTIIRIAVEHSVATEPSLRSRARSTLSSLAANPLLRIILPQNSSNAMSVLPLGTEACQALTNILLRREHDNATGPDHYHRISWLLNNVSGFNMPVCQLELKNILGVACETDESSVNAVAKGLMKKLEIATPSHISVWARLVSELPADDAKTFREMAENDLLSSFLTNIDYKSKRSKSYIDAMLIIVEASASNIHDAETSSVVEQVIERLSSFLASPPFTNFNLSDKGRAERSDEHIHVLLRLLTIHKSSIQHSKYPQDRLINLLVSLSLLLTHPYSCSNSRLSEHIFDVLTLLSDSLTDGTRLRCICTLRDYHGTRDPRLRFIFGYSERAEGEWLHLVSKSSPTSDRKNAKVAGRTKSTQPYALRVWEMVQETTPVQTENDTCIDLSLFGAKKSVL